RAANGSCAFAPRCRFRAEACVTTAPPLRPIAPDHLVRCLRAEELGAIPSNRDLAHAAALAEADKQALLSVRDVVCASGTHDPVLAVDGVSFQVAPGETLGIVGESGSGKSTLLRAIAGLLPPLSGEIRLEGELLAPRARLRSIGSRRALQIVFQNPDA